MAPKPKPWLRLYTETTRDRKLRRAKPETRWLWVAVGHARMETTARYYLRRVTLAQMRDAMEGRDYEGGQQAA